MLVQTRASQIRVCECPPRGYSGLGSTALGKTRPPGKRPLPAHLVLLPPQGDAVLRGRVGGGVWFSLTLTLEIVATEQCSRAPGG